jgi:hypothetical protein
VYRPTCPLLDPSGSGAGTSLSQKNPRDGSVTPSRNISDSTHRDSVMPANPPERTTVTLIAEPKGASGRVRPGRTAVAAAVRL